MGLCVPWGRLFAGNGTAIRVLTCNIAGKCANNERLNALIRDTSPDIVALQECRGEVHVDLPPGWHVLRKGEILVASRYVLREGRTIFGEHPGHRWPRLNLLHCVVESPVGDIPFVALHLPSPRYGITGILDRTTLIRPSQRGEMVGETALRRQASQVASQSVGQLGEAVFVVGDFNMPADSAIYRECWGRLSDAFSAAGFGFGYSMWPTIRGWQFGIRIDHILTGSYWRSRRCWVGPDVGSDHLPLIAEIVWDGPEHGR